MEEDNVYNYAEPVYKAIQEPNILLGVGIGPAVGILVFTIVLVNLVNLWCSIVGVVLFLVVRKICKKDPHTLTILFEKILEPTRYWA